MKRLIVVTTVFLVICSCVRQRDRRQISFSSPMVVEANGTALESSIPQVVVAGKPKRLAEVTTKIANANVIVHVAGDPAVNLVGKPRIISPGTDTFLIPKTFEAIDSPFIAGIPEVVEAKDAYTKDENPQNFSSFGKLQGLKYGDIYCVMQDRSGNLWFGTNGGGVTRYDGKYFTHFTEKEGLSANSIVCMLEDRRGNLWFGTFGGGATRYDGIHFTHFKKEQGLSDNAVMSMVQDKKGDIWFGTNGGGVCRYDGKTFTHFAEKEGLSNNTVWSILQDKSGNLWFATKGGGVNKYDGKNFEHYGVKEGLPNNSVWSLLEDRLGNIWMGTWGGGVVMYDGNRVEAIENGEDVPLQLDLKTEKGKLVKTFSIFTKNEGLSNNDVRVLLQDNIGNIWFGTRGGGASKYDGKYFTHFTEREGLSNNLVMSLHQDRSGNIWLGTFGGGINKYDGRNFTHFTEKEGLSSKDVRSLFQDGDGSLWLGTYNGGINKYDGKTVTQFVDKDGILKDVRSIQKDRNGNLWFGTRGNGVVKYDGNSFYNYTEREGLSNNDVRAMLLDKGGDIWFGTNGGGACKFDGVSFSHFNMSTGLSANAITSMIQDSVGNIWFGTYDGGATRYDGTRFARFSIQEGLSNNNVVSLLEDQHGNIWLGTNGGGVNKYDGNRVEKLLRGECVPSMGEDSIRKVNGRPIRSLTRFTEKEGLSSDFVMSMLQDRRGDIWFGTRFGLSKLVNDQNNATEDDNVKNSDKDEVFFKSYTYEDGFLGIGCNANSLLEDSKGTIWIGTNNRLSAYHYGGEVSDTIPPNLQLMGITLFNENIPWSNLATVRPLQGNEQQEYVAKDTSFVLGNGVVVSDLEFEGVSKWYGVPENMSLDHNSNYLTFSFIGITQKQSKKVKYQYKLEGLDENWSALSYNTKATYGNLPHGEYTFRAKAMNSSGYWSKECKYTFVIRPPWWKTIWFRMAATAMIVVSLYSIYLLRTRSLRRSKKILEHRVQQRTEEISAQNEELLQNQEEIASQRDRLAEQNIMLQEAQAIIEGQNDEIRLRNRNLEDEVHNRTAELVEYNKQLEQFAFISAHNLRAPVARILGLGQILSLTPEGAKERDAVIKRLIATTVELDTVVKDLNKILDVKHDNHQSLVEVNLNQELASIESSLRQDIDESGAVISKDFSRVQTIKTIKPYIDSIVLNLISNAIKYRHPERVPEILVTSDCVNGFVCLCFSDNGLGIDLELHKEKLFSLYNRFHFHIEGKGIGLYLVRTQVEAMGGKIEVYSTPEEGTTFKVFLKQ